MLSRSMLTPGFQLPITYSAITYQNAFLESISIVTGPSFTSSTSIIA